MTSSQDDRLDSWKQIAAYLGRTERTAMRWAQRLGLPVHRLQGTYHGSVFAYRSEIDVWRTRTEASASGSDHLQNSVVNDRAEPERHEAASARRGRAWYVGAAAAVVILGILGYWNAYYRSSPTVFRYQQLTNDGYAKSGLLTDGSRVYFVETRPRGNVVAEVPAAGGAVTPISTFLRDPSLLAINARLSEILVADKPGFSLGRLWIVPLDGGEPQRVGAVDSSVAAWSPDGSTIAYAEGNELRLCRIDGSDDRRIATLPSAISWISWQGHSDALRVSLDPSPGPESWVWQVRDDGSNLQKVQVGGAEAAWSARGEWSQSGHFFLETLGSPGDPGTLWAFPKQPWYPWVGKGRAIKIDTGPLHVAYFASSATPGEVFVAGGVPNSQFERYDIRSRQFVPFLEGTSGDEATFSPDGQSVVYVNEPTQNLLEEKLSTSSTVSLTLPPLGAELPRYSPDGKWIAFMGRKSDGRDYHVYLVPAGGGQYHRVTKANESDGAPTWSPDGTTLAFGEIGDPAGPPGSRGHIHLFDLKTGKESNLPDSQGLWTARWSPDGKHIAAVTVDLRSLVVFSFRTRRWTKVAVGEAIADLDWSKDGRAIYVLEGVGPNDFTIFDAKLHGRRVERIASLKELDSVTGWMGLTPDGSPLVARWISPTEVYAIRWDGPGALSGEHP